MESSWIPGFSGASVMVKKRRSSVSRRPWADPQLALYDRNPFLPSSVTSGDGRAKFSAEVKELFLKNHTSLENINKVPQSFKRSGWSDGHGGSNKQAQNESDSKHPCGGVLALHAPTNNGKIAIIGKHNLDNKSTCQDDSLGKSGGDCITHVSSQKRLRVKLKLGGVTQTLHVKSDLSGNSSSSAKASTPLDPSQDQQQHISLGGAAYDSDAFDGLSSPPLKKIRKKSRSEREYSDADYVSHPKRKNQKKESAPEVRPEPLTTRRRALQSGQCGAGSSLVEFPNGLPFESSRKRTERSEEEKLAKKVEAAQRRKMQMEKAAKESEAMAIRKIRGTKSDKKAEKYGARADRAKAVNSETLSNKIRLVMGPSGTVVIFPDDVALPSIFDSKPCSYPPPREKCAGPSCTNPYKYRDSRSNLPLCSLLCYRAVQGSARSLTTC